MNPLLIKLLGNSLTNPRTTIAGVLYVLSKWGCPLLATWMPEYKTKLDYSANLLEGAAVWYGFTQAGDAAKSLTRDEGLTKVEANTTFIAKADVNKPTV